MRTCYKYWYIMKDAEGYITDVTVRFFEGEYQTEIVDEEEKIVFKRLKRLNPTKGDDLMHLAKEVNGKLVLPIQKEDNGKDTIYYNQADFGKIKTKEEIDAFINTEIAKDKGREVVEEQKI